MTLHYFRRRQGEIRISRHSNSRSLVPSGRGGGRPLPRTKNLLGRWKPRKEGRAFQSSLRISETGARNALPRPLEQSFSRLTRASAALVLGPVLQPQYSLSRKLSDNTECRRHQIRKTNLSLQTISINSNSRYFAQNARPCSFAFRRYALPTARFARQTLAVEWKVSSQARNIISDSTGHITLSCEAYCRGVLGKAKNHCPSTLTVMMKS